MSSTRHSSDARAGKHAERKAQAGGRAGLISDTARPIRLEDFSRNRAAYYYIQHRRKFQRLEQTHYSGTDSWADIRFPSRSRNS